jgi:hypothetical protein
LRAPARREAVAHTCDRSRSTTSDARLGADLSPRLVQSEVQSAFNIDRFNIGR